MTARPICIINVVGMTPQLLNHAPCLSQLHTAQAWTPPIPAVTCTAQATMLTGLPPSQHGIVGNGWYFRDTQEVRFWQQANSLMESDLLYQGIDTANLFWWFNQASGIKYSVTPKPHYGCDGSKVFDIIDQTDCQLTARLGPFPFFSFWGPAAGLPCSQWIAQATSLVLREKRPELTLAYLPHLDYDGQRHSQTHPDRVREVDACAAQIVSAAESIGATVVVVSEYGLTAVDQPIAINRVLRNEGWLTVRDGPFGEMLRPADSLAFAVVDHQIAHIYVRDPSRIDDVRTRLESVDGIDQVVDPQQLDLDHPRSGELIALAESHAWFTYYYWLDDHQAPDFARTVDIHRKPGYDPCELFLTSRTRAALRVMQKKLGFRYRMDVIPLTPQRVRGSHGLITSAGQGPLIIGPGELPHSMHGFRDYIQRLRME